MDDKFKPRIITPEERQQLDIDLINEIDILLLRRLKGEITNSFCIAEIKEAVLNHSLGKFSSTR